MVREITVSNQLVSLASRESQTDAEFINFKDKWNVSNQLVSLASREDYYKALDEQQVILQFPIN